MINAVMTLNTSSPLLMVIELGGKFYNKIVYLRIIEAMETGQPFTFGGNVLNKGLITNLPEKAVVEVTCVAERNRITPCAAGDLPEQLAALNRTNINTQLLTIEAAITKRKEHIYHAALLDPHTAAELSMDDIVSMCDELIEAHGDWLPEFE